MGMFMQSFPATDKRLAQIRAFQEEDATCQHIVRYCQTEWPTRQNPPPPPPPPPEILPFLHVASELNVHDGLLLRGTRIVIPGPLREEMLRHIHSGHQGLVKCRERARQSVWWPGLSAQLERLVKRCTVCRKSLQQRPQPLLNSELPQLQWQKLGTEWRHKHYLIVIDYYSRYVEIALLTNTTADEVIKHM